MILKRVNWYLFCLLNRWMEVSIEPSHTYIGICFLCDSLCDRASRFPSPASQGGAASRSPSQNFLSSSSLLWRLSHLNLLILLYHLFLQIFFFFSGAHLQICQFRTTLCLSRRMWKLTELMFCLRSLSLDPYLLNPPLELHLLLPQNSLSCGFQRSSLHFSLFPRSLLPLLRRMAYHLFKRRILLSWSLQLCGKTIWWLSFTELLRR